MSEMLKNRRTCILNTVLVPVKILSATVLEASH